MIGPTGVGKTEIARRLARLANAPFIKVEATKFTEVGYVGRDVESIIRDLADIAVKMAREQEMAKLARPGRGGRRGAHPRRPAAAARQLRGGQPRDRGHHGHPREVPRQAARRRAGRARGRDPGLGCPLGVEIMAPPGMEEMTSQLQGLFQNLGQGRTKRRKLRIRDARKLLRDEEAAKRVNEEDLKLRAIENVEQNGIVFLDEIDKVTRRAEGMAGADVSREGVQRDLLPLVEGSTVSTKHGIGAHRPHPVHRLRGLPPGPALGPDPGAAGAPAHPGGAQGADHRRLRAHPDRAGRLADRPVHRPCWPPRGSTWSSPRTASGASPRSPGRSTSAPRTSAPGACTRSWSACWRTSPTTPPSTWIGSRSPSTPPMWTRTWPNWRRTRTCPATSCRSSRRAAGMPRPRRRLVAPFNPTHARNRVGPRGSPAHRAQPIPICTHAARAPTDRTQETTHAHPHRAQPAPAVTGAGDQLRRRLPFQPALRVPAGLLPLRRGPGSRPRRAGPAGRQGGRRHRPDRARRQLRHLPALRRRATTPASTPGSISTTWARTRSASGRSTSPSWKRPGTSARSRPDATRADRHPPQIGGRGPRRPAHPVRPRVRLFARLPARSQLPKRSPIGSPEAPGARPSPRTIRTTWRLCSGP